MGMSSHPDWEWVEVGHSSTSPPGDLSDHYQYGSFTQDHIIGQPDFDHDPGVLPDGLSPHFDPISTEHVIGAPGEDMWHWHHQTNADTCAVVAQESVLESVTGHQFSENQLMDEAITHGWYTPGGGTPLNNVGKLLEAHGVPVQRQDGASLSDIVDQLNQHHKVIAAVNAEDIWNAAHPANGGLPVDAYPGIPGQHADHAVEVIGIDTSKPDNPMVVLNDSGIPDGRGVEVPAAVFEEAFSTSGNFMVHTVDPGESTSHSADQLSGLRLGEWKSVPVYDEDGYHVDDNWVYRDTSS